MRTKTGDRIMQVIRPRSGSENAISAPDICVAIGWPVTREREVRRIIHNEEALWPFLTCSIPGKGFFAAATHEEVLAHDNWLRDLHEKSGHAWDRFHAKALTYGFRLAHPKNRRHTSAAA